jgi:hypothetical protein
VIAGPNLEIFHVSIVASVYGRNNILDVVRRTASVEAAGLFKP